MSIVTEKIQSILAELDTKVQIDQLKRISSLLQYQYSMWNNASPEYQNIDYSTLVKQCNDFIRVFVPYFENDTFPIDDSLKLFFSTIENFFNIKPFDKKLLEILAYYMEMVLDPSVDFWTCYKLVESLESIISKLDQETRVEYFNKKCINVYKLMDILCTCGDYSFQEMILKLIFELIPGGKCDTKLAYYFFPDDKFLQEQILHVNDSPSQSKFRTFLNEVNSKNPSVFSIRAKAVYGDTVVILPPDFHGSDKEIWVDFNVKSESVSIQCALEGLSSNLPLSSMICDTMFIYKIIIGNINIKSTKRQQVILINIADRISMSSQYAKEFTQKCRTVKIVLQKSLDQQELVNTYLPKIFGSLILGENNNSAETNEFGKVDMCKQLKVDVKSTCSSKNSNDSDSQREMDNSRKIKTTEYKALVTARKSTNASSRNSISIRSFALDLNKNIENGDDNSASIISDNNDENFNGTPNILVCSIPIKQQNNIQIIEKPIEITKDIRNMSIEDNENQSKSLIVQFSEDRSNLQTKDIEEDISQMSILPSQTSKELTALESKSQAILNCSRNIMNKNFTASDHVLAMNNVLMDNVNKLQKSLEHLNTVENASKEKSFVRANFLTKQYTKPSTTLCTLGSISEDEEYFDQEEEPVLSNVFIAEKVDSGKDNSTNEESDKSTSNSQVLTKSVDLIRNVDKSNRLKQVEENVLIVNQIDPTIRQTDIFYSQKFEEEVSKSVKETKSVTAKHIIQGTEFFIRNNKANSMKLEKSMAENQPTKILVTKINENETLNLSSKQEAENKLCNQNLSRNILAPEHFNDNDLIIVEPKKKENLKAANNLLNCSYSDINLTDMSELVQEMKKRERIYNDLEINDSKSEMSKSEVESPIRPIKLLLEKKKICRIIEEGNNENSEPILEMCEVDGEINKEITTIEKAIDLEASNISKYNEYIQSNENSIESKTMKDQIVKDKVESKSAKYQNNEDKVLLEKDYVVSALGKTKTNYEEERVGNIEKNIITEEIQISSVNLVDQNDIEREVTKESLSNYIHKKQFKRKKTTNKTNAIDISSESSLSISFIEKPMKNAKKFKIFDDENENKSKKRLPMNLANTSEVDEIKITKKVTKTLPKRVLQDKKNINVNIVEDGNSLIAHVPEEIKKKKVNSLQTKNKKIAKSKITNTKEVYKENENIDISELQNKESLHKMVNTTLNVSKPNFEMHGDENQSINEITENKNSIMFDNSVIATNTDETMHSKIGGKKTTKRNPRSKKTKIQISNTTIENTMECKEDNVSTNKKNPLNDHIISDTILDKELQSKINTPLLQSGKSIRGIKQIEDKGDNGEDVFRKITIEALKNSTLENSIIAEGATQKVMERTDVEDQSLFPTDNITQTEIGFRKEAYADAQQLSKKRDIKGRDGSQENRINNSFNILFGQKSCEEIVFETCDNNLRLENEIIPIDDDLSIIEVGENCGNSAKNSTTTNKTHNLTLQYINYLKSLRKKDDAPLQASQSETNVSQNKSSKWKLQNPVDLSCLDKKKASKIRQSPINKSVLNCNKFIENVIITSNTKDRKRTLLNLHEPPIQSKRPYYEESNKRQMDPYDFDFNEEKKSTSNSNTRAGELFKEIYRKLEKSRKGSKRASLTLPKRISNKNTRVSKNTRKLDKTSSKFQILQDVRVGQDADSFDGSSDVIKEINAFKEKLLRVFEEGVLMVNDVTSKLKNAASKRHGGS